MKILYFISVHGHGRGGHFHSLNHISRKIGEQHDVKIISFGPGRSDIIESNPFFYKHFFFNGVNLITLSKDINKARREFNPDIYHCFDVGGYNIVRLIVSTRRNKIILNKCGGPNPNYYPHIHNLILFSIENKNWFNNNSNYNNSNIHLIPNRVRSLKLDDNFWPIEKKINDFVFIRICRIGIGYKKSINDSINLIRVLNSIRINVKLFVIGVVEDKNIFLELQEDELVKKGKVVFLVDAEFTNEASKMLYLADAVIGTGRGLMEAASLGKPILAIDKNGDIPVLLNEESFTDAFKTNFSERNTFENLNNDRNIRNIEKLIYDKESYSMNSKFSIDCFNEFFSLDKVSDHYTLAYTQAKTGNRQIVNDLPIILKSAIGFFKSYHKSNS
ncbi:glycosyltransferase [Dysgonomonadaceae bacterium zrk40]|nr:glycosyltransferase [Dysgonomonadaceae bacterium zrk40]